MNDSDLQYKQIINVNDIKLDTSIQGKPGHNNDIERNDSFVSPSTVETTTPTATTAVSDDKLAHNLLRKVRSHFQFSYFPHHLIDDSNNDNK